MTPPEMPAQQRIQGGYSARVDEDPHGGGPCVCDWSIPTTAAALRHRVLEVPDQSRYGHATSTAARRRADTPPPPCRECGRPEAECRRRESVSGHTYAAVGS